MMKRHSWPIRAVLFSGAMAFCLAPAIAQHHDDKDEKTEHVDKSHHKDHKGHKDAAHGHDAHGGAAPGGHGGAAHGGHGGAAHGGHGDAAHGGHGEHHGDHHGGVLGAVGKVLTGAAHGGHDAHGHHAGPERAPGHHFTYHGKRHEAFRGPAFHWPHGHAYHRRHVGWAMPLLFLSAQYILHDYGMYGLEPPPPGAEWVRYGPDIMLVDRHTGHVIRVIYGAFVP